MKHPFALIAVFAATLTAAPSFAKEEAPEEAVGYGGARVQLQPIMAPYRTPTGVRYEVITARLVLATGENERPACFMIPIIQEKFLLYLYDAKLEPADFVGQRREVLAKNLFDIAIRNTDRGYYSGLELVDQNSPALDPKSQTLSTQCK